MLSRTVNCFTHTVAQRGICCSVANRRRYIPHEQLSSDLLSLKGLVRNKEVFSLKKKKFDASEHESKSPSCYGTINIKVEGYDLVVVEKFAEVVHRLVLREKIPLREVYALPPEYTAVKHIPGVFTSNPDHMETEAELATYTRIIQVSSLSSTAAPILIRSLVQDIPPGVKLSMEKYTSEDYHKRYKENKELLAAREEFKKLRASR